MTLPPRLPTLYFPCKIHDDDIHSPTFLKNCTTEKILLLSFKPAFYHFAQMVINASYSFWSFFESMSVRSSRPCYLNTCFKINVPLRFRLLLAGPWFSSVAKHIHSKAWAPLDGCLMSHSFRIICCIILPDLHQKHCNTLSQVDDFSSRYFTSTFAKSIPITL